MFAGTKKITKFEIQFENPQIAYRPGEKISGKVFLEVAAELELRAITLELRGEAVVQWYEYERESESEPYERKVYQSKKIYINVKHYLFGDSQRADSKMVPGSYTYPFSFRLPKNLPNSYKGINGDIAYFLKCNMDLPRNTDRNIRIDLNILSLYDPNDFHLAGMSLSNERTKMLQGFLCKGGQLRATISISKKCYVCGEMIIFSAYIENFSRKRMTKSYVRLVQYETVTAKSDGRTETRSGQRNILAVQEASIAPGRTFTWSNAGLLIPSLPPSQLIHCNFISLSYSVVLSVHPSGWLDNRLEVPISVNIGNVPLHQYHNPVGPRNDHTSSNAAPQPGPYPKAKPQPGPYPNATPQPGPYPNTTSQPGPYPNAAPQPGPYPNATPQPGPHPNAAPQPGPYPNATQNPGPYPNATPQPGPYPNATPQQGPYPNAIPQPGPYPNATPQQGPYPNATPQPGPYPNATPQPGPYPNATPQPGPYPNATPQQGPYPNATLQPGPYPNATPQPGPYPNTKQQLGHYPNGPPQSAPNTNAPPLTEPDPKQAW